jgi:hypothetical protein
MPFSVDSRTTFGLWVSAVKKEDRMFRNLALLGFCGLALVGCRGDDLNPSAVDLSRPNLDLSFNPNSDLSMNQVMMSSSAHDIDTGAVAAGTEVKLSGVISIDNIHRHLSKTTMYCEYTSYITDANCTSGPCGLQLYQRGMKLAAGSTTTDCPSPYGSGNSGVPLAAIQNYGDVVEVTGMVKNLPDTMAPMTVVLHSVSVDSLTVTMAKGPMPTPIAVTDTATSLFTIHSGMGYITYEGAYVLVTPPSGKFSVASYDSTYGFITNNGAYVSTGDYFGPKDGGTFPPMTATFSSIAGLVSSDYGGALTPLRASDYTP